MKSRSLTTGDLYEVTSESLKIGTRKLKQKKSKCTQGFNPELHGAELHSPTVVLIS